MQDIVNPNILLAAICGAAAVVICIVLYLISKRGNVPDDGTQAATVRQRTQPCIREDGPRVAGARRRAPRARMQRQRDDSDEEPANDEFDDQGETKKIGAKKQKKLEEKAMKKAMREEEERDREDRKLRQAEMDEMRKQKELEEEEKEKKLEEEENKRKEEEEKREYEEYLKLKETFTIEEEGQEEILSDEQTKSKLQEFINYIKREKVVILEELGAHFDIRTQEAIKRVQELQEQGMLTGVIDDRGKFIFITPQELEDVAKFIRQRGRVSISELAEASNTLINLTPERTQSSIEATA
ncbi:putative DDRGK domain-containing protein 1 [Apostichopus japonicus]|uniref:DDRGK domain-containing protein 1 n=1 Tax=Stichopus japonicus TaxID=307972 RepID=A0A2G8KXX5_STIJA|nr:putative DDRGK domain-containing protein 1 [Apostichopus japonicus]